MPNHADLIAHDVVCICETHAVAIEAIFIELMDEIIQPSRRGNVQDSTHSSALNDARR